MIDQNTRAGRGPLLVIIRLVLSPVPGRADARGGSPGKGVTPAVCRGIDGSGVFRTIETCGGTDVNHQP